MKKIILFASLFGVGTISYSQATDGTATGNIYGATKFLGWGGTTGLLEFRTGNITRMNMQSALTSSYTDGRVSLGPVIAAGFAPQARLHLTNFGTSGAVNAEMFRTDGPATVDNTWRLWTGPAIVGSTEKFKLYVPANTSNTILQNVQQTGNMYMATNGATMRMRINGRLSPTINGSVVNTEGYIGIGNFTSNTPLPEGSTGPWHQVHIYGPNNYLPGYFGSGYRTWQNTGIGTYENSDQIYVGMKPETSYGTNFSDAVIAFGDDESDPYHTGGPLIGDNFRIIASVASGAAGDGTNYTSSSSFNGREIMRMTTTGLVGVGPAFDKNNETKSTMHLHTENATSNWLQISNQYTGTAGVPPYAGPTAIAGSDGLRLGILGNSNSNINGYGFVYNQENRPLLFSTNANTLGLNITTAATSERFRLMSVNTPTTLLVPFTVGVFNPAGLSANTTRTSISYNPSQPIVRPVSLMHIGFGSSVTSAYTVVDGYRKWMDIGTYTASNADNMYIGLKQKGTNEKDAVIGWGRNLDSAVNILPEHLRFIFATNLSSTVDHTAANDEDGQEMARFYPGRDTTGLNTGSPYGTYGRFGVGDFTAAGVNQEPTHKLDVVGNARLRLLPDSLYKADATVKKTVMVDEDGVLRWTDQQPSSFGYECGDTAAVGLTTDRFMPMNDHNFYFTGQGVPTTNAVGLGFACGASMPGKFNVYQNDTGTVLVNTIAGVFINQDTVDISVGSKIITAVKGVSNASQTANGTTNIGGDFNANNANTANYGVRGSATSNTTATAGICTGGYFQATANTPNAVNTGVQANAEVTGSGITATNYGVRASATGGVNNYGIYSTVVGAGSPGPGTPAGPNYAGYFNGDVYISGTYGPSDINLKEDIDSLTNSLAIVKQLNPKTYHFKHAEYPSMNLPVGLQYGLIAQEVEEVLPDFVSNNLHPAVTDSTGAVIVPEVHFKGLGYQQFVPLLIGAVKEQQSQIDSLTTTSNNYDSIINVLSEKNHDQDSVINDLSSRLSQLEACISALHLCDGGSALAPANSGSGEKSTNISNVELKDAQSVVLDQNVPNPFAEQTVITYELPQSVQKAQILFYNAEGKLINSVDLNERGKGQLNVFANDLSNGIYTYTLVVDGQIKGTKRMVKNK